MSIFGNFCVDALCKDPSLFDLVSYCDVRVQSNPFILKGDKRVLVERALQELCGGEVRSNWVQDSQATGLYRRWIVLRNSK